MVYVKVGESGLLRDNVLTCLAVFTSVALPSNCKISF